MLFRSWSLAPKWSCLIVVMQCASNATAIGNWKPLANPLTSPFFQASPLMIFFPNYRNIKSESCPFCRGSLKRVNSEDLWVLTCNDDVVDNKTVFKEDLLHFYLYINSLPKDYPDALFLVYYEYLI